MRLGIDFGTTRIAVAAADRGNYPIVTFDGPDETSWDWFPPFVALRGQERIYGFEAWSAQADPDWVLVRSLKRLLADASLTESVRVGDVELAVHQTIIEMASALKNALMTASTLRPSGTASIEVMLGVPANANTNQRFLTADAFQRAGFTVLGMLNEPSAASIELGHTHKSAPAAPNRVLVYDFGGGTFDASLVVLDATFTLWSARRASGRSAATTSMRSWRTCRSTRPVLAWNACRRPRVCGWTRNAGGRRKDCTRTPAG